MPDRPTTGTPLPNSIARAWYGPGQSIPPIAPPTTEPRVRDYVYNTNINYAKRKYERISFEQMRNLATENYLMRVILEKVKARLCMVRWEFRLRSQDPGEHLASIRERSNKDSRIKFLYKFFERPDKEHDWPEWLNAVLEDRFVIDAASLWVARDSKDKIDRLVSIDGSTINRITDAIGMTPQPPYAAYQQLVKGMPAIDMTTEDLLYMPANYRAHKLFGFCYDSETEILTRTRGFVKFADLLEGEEVATRSAAKQFEWQVPLYRTNTTYRGTMYRMQSRSMSLQVTPEHRMLVSMSARDGVRRESVMLAKDFVAGLNHERKIPVTSSWQGAELGEQLFTREKGKGYEVRISGDDFCALMGAYLAEGNIRSQGGIEVAQRRESKGWKEYKALFDRLKGCHSDRTFILAKRSITNYFRQFGKAHEKFVPQIIMDATPRQIAIFLHFYGLGDGCFDERENQSGRGQDFEYGIRYTTVSRRLADDIVELEQKIGRSASVGVRPASEQRIMAAGREYISACRESYVICVRHSEAMAVNVSEVDYDGTVHCVTVPNGIVYVRRNGKPCWCGNSEVEQTIRIGETQIQRAIWTLNHYTEGNIPELLLLFKGENYTAQQIEQYMQTFEAQLNGQNGQRQRAYPLPDATVHELRGKELYDQFDEWLARIFCYQLGEPPTALVKAVNRASAQQMDDSREESGEQPYINWIRVKLNRIIQDPLYFGWEDIEAMHLDSGEVDPFKQAQIDQINVPLGITTVDEARVRDGKAPENDDQKAERLASQQKGNPSEKDDNEGPEKAAGAKKKRLSLVPSNSRRAVLRPGENYVY